MVEQWIQTARSKYDAHQRKVFEGVSRIPTRAWGAAILLLALLLAGARPLWNYTHKPDEARLDAIADEVGSISFMISGARAWWSRADAPLINHAGTQALFCQTSENGAAIVALDLSTGEKTQIFEELGNQILAGPTMLLHPHSWSPDDSKVIYAFGTDYSSESLFVAEATTGRSLAKIEIPGVRKTVWLTQGTFVCVDSVGDIHSITEQADRSWKETGIISIGAKGKIPGRLPLTATQQDSGGKSGAISVNGRYDGLTALSSNTVAWQETNQILSLDLSAQRASVLFRFQGERLNGFNYSKETGEYLLRGNDGARDSLWRWQPGKEGVQDADLITTADAGVNTWLSEGRGYVSFNRGALTVRTDASAKAVRVLEHWRIASFACTPDEKHLIIVGACSNEPASGIWNYDIGANTERCLAAAAGHGLEHVAPATGPEHRLIPVRNGHWFTVNIFKPVAFDRHRAHPVVIANTPFSGAEPYLQQYALAVQNAGGYFVAIDRHDWSDTEGTQEAWATNEAKVIDMLAGDPTVDRSRIFLVSNCVESRWAGLYASAYPGRCRGIFTLVGNEFPDAANLVSGRYPTKIFDSACDAWEEDGQRLKEYQIAAARSGVPMDYMIHSHTMHDFIGQRSQRERIHLLLHFVFDN